MRGKIHKKPGCYEVFDAFLELSGEAPRSFSWEDRAREYRLAKKLIKDCGSLEKALEMLRLFFSTDKASSLAIVLACLPDLEERRQEKLRLARRAEESRKALAKIQKGAAS